MKIEELDESRRRFLVWALATGSLHLLPGLAHGQSIREISGPVWVDGQVASADTVISASSTVRTGAGAQATFVIAKDAFLVREHSEVRFEAVGNGIAGKLRLLTGAIMGVFGGGSHSVRTTHITAGIRGSGIYAEADPGETYFCVCYGAADVSVNGDPQTTQTVSSEVHNAHVFTPPARGRSARIVRAGLQNHTDKELYLLESFVGRTPPFRLGEYNYGGGDMAGGDSR